MKTAPSTNPLIAKHYDELVALCREFGVSRLELFGSASTDDFDLDRSDLDFLVEYPDGYDFGPWLGRRQDFQDRLSQLFGHPVDLAIYKQIENPFVRASIQETRQLLYAA